MAPEYAPELKEKYTMKWGPTRKPQAISCVGGGGGGNLGGERRVAYECT